MPVTVENVSALATAFGQDMGNARRDIITADSKASAAQNPPFRPFTSRVQAIATAIPPLVQQIEIAGLHFIADPTGTALETAGGRRWSPLGDVTPGHFGAIPGATTEVAAVAATAAMQAAYDWAADNGRPLRIGRGPWVVHLPVADQVPGASGHRVGALRWDKDRAVVLGAGMDVSVVRCFENSGRYAAVQMVRLPLENGVTKINGGMFADITFDSNCADTLTWENHTAPVRCAGLRDFTFERVKFCNSGHYGLALQNGGFVNVRVSECVFENTAKDAVDLKNNVNASGASVGFGLHIKDCVIRNCGRATDAAPNALIDVMGWGVVIDGVTFEDIRMEASNTASLIRVKQGMDETLTRGVAGWGTIIRNVIVKWTPGAPEMATALIDIRAPYCLVDGLKVYGTPGGVGVTASQPFCRVTNSRLVGMATGALFRTIVGGTVDNAFAGGDDCQVIGNVFENCTTAVITNRARTRVQDNHVLNCGTFANSSGPNTGPMEIVGNYLSGVTTPLALASNPGHLILNNRGMSGPIARATLTGGSAVAIAQYLAPDHRFYSGDDSTSQELLRITSAGASNVNGFQMAGGLAGNPAHLLAIGADANIDLRFSPKGAGLMRFGTLTASADAAITGYIEIRDASGVIRRLAVIS